MGKFKIGDRVKSDRDTNVCTVIGVHEPVRCVWLLTDGAAQPFTRGEDYCTLYVPPPEVGRMYTSKKCRTCIGELVAIRDDCGVLYLNRFCWSWPLADLIPAEAP